MTNELEAFLSKRGTPLKDYDLEKANDVLEALMDYLMENEPYATESITHLREASALVSGEV